MTSGANYFSGRPKLAFLLCFSGESNTPLATGQGYRAERGQSHGVTELLYRWILTNNPRVTLLRKSEHASDHRGLRRTRQRGTLELEAPGCSSQRLIRQKQTPETGLVSSELTGDSIRPKHMRIQSALSYLPLAQEKVTCTSFWTGDGRGQWRSDTTSLIPLVSCQLSG